MRRDRDRLGSPVRGTSRSFRFDVRYDGTTASSLPCSIRRSRLGSASPTQCRWLFAPFVLLILVAPLEP